MNISLSGGRPSKFLYSGKNNKSNPWNTSVDDHGDDLDHSLQPINKFTKTKDSPNPPGMMKNFCRFL